jgi:hypothetical protein
VQGKKKKKKGGGSRGSEPSFFAYMHVCVRVCVCVRACTHLPQAETAGGGGTAPSDMCPIAPIQGNRRQHTSAYVAYVSIRNVCLCVRVEAFVRATHKAVTYCNYCLFKSMYFICP